MPDFPIQASATPVLDFTMDVPGPNTPARSAMFQAQMQQLLDNDKALENLANTTGASLTTIQAALTALTSLNADDDPRIAALEVLSNILLNLAAGDYITVNAGHSILNGTLGARAKVSMICVG
jgi:hypothetical protein